MLSSNGAARSFRSVENVPVAILRCAPRSCSTCLRRPRLCSPPLRRLLENQLPITTQEQRGSDWPSCAATSTVGPLLLLLRLYSIVVQPRRHVRLEVHRRRLHGLQERNRSSFVRCARSLASRRACCCCCCSVASWGVCRRPSRAVMARRARCRGGPRGRGTGPASSSPPERHRSASAVSSPERRKSRTGDPPSAGSAGCPSG
jgi:hypothetical protein